MKLSTHFALAEFTTSQTAARRGIDNTPPPEVIAALHRTALGLEMVRALIQCPIHINSGYRSPALNKAIGGARNSQHTRGEAADIVAPGFGTPAELVKAIIAHPEIAFDQCILEFDSWCHISFTANPRRQALVIDRAGTRVFA
jgi:zinc D-Ala-D-Ala carboxypeptidase